VGTFVFFGFYPTGYWDDYKPREQKVVTYMAHKPARLPVHGHLANLCNNPPV